MVTSKGTYCTDCNNRGRGRNLRLYEAGRELPDLKPMFELLDSLGVPPEALKRMYYEIFRLGMEEASSIFGDPHSWEGDDDDTHLCFGSGGYIGRRKHEIMLNNTNWRLRMEDILHGEKEAAGEDQETDRDS
jgi:hypothetical protein